MLPLICKIVGHDAYRCLYTGIVQTASKSGKCQSHGDYPAGKPAHEESVRCRYPLARARQGVVSSRRDRFVKMD
jgi:hypothetical protein